MERRVVEVILQGRRFTLRTDEDPEALQEIVDFANRAISEVSDSGAVNQHNAALLTVLTLARELTRERENLVALRESIRVKSGQILGMLIGVGIREESGDDPPVRGDGL